MASTSPGYGITIRVDGPASAQPVSEITQAILAAGATITALDVVESVLDRVVIDVTCDAIDADHAEAITATLSQNPNLNVRKVSDRTFLLHLGGKIEIASKVPLKTRDDLSRAYTPGVARISQAIAKDPSDLRRLTIKRNTVAVVTDGSAVLGLGNIGPGAALPVMEGKAALFKRFADVDAYAKRVKLHRKASLVKTQTCRQKIKTPTTLKILMVWRLLIIQTKCDLFIFKKEFRHVSFTSSLCRFSLGLELRLGCCAKCQTHQIDGGFPARRWYRCGGPHLG